MVLDSSNILKVSPTKETGSTAKDKDRASSRMNEKVGSTLVSSKITKLKDLANILGRVVMSIWATFRAQRNQVSVYTDGLQMEQNTKDFGRTT